MSWLLKFFYCCISFTAILTFSENVPARGFGKRESGTNFLEHFHWFLNVKASVSITAHDAMACALECLRHSFCLSFNFAVSPGRHDCELLREDKYTFSDRFEPSQFYHHYSMASPCEYGPCSNGAACRPLYGSKGYFCQRIPGNIEQGAPWIKLNRGEVQSCFGAKNNSYGNFTIVSTGTVIALKLVYISGFVTCNNRDHPYGSHWACKKGSRIGTIVTNATNEVIFPQNYQNKAYWLPGYHENSSELVLNGLSPPVRVAAGDEYRIWYHEDFMDRGERDNDGHTCVDVYALYM